MTVLEAFHQILPGEDPANVMVTPDDIVAAGGCARGMFRQHSGWGFTRADVRDFIDHGISVERLKDFDDARIIQTVRVAAERVAHERG